MKLQTKEIKSRVALVNVILLMVFSTSIIFSYINVEKFKRFDEMVIILSFMVLLYLSYLGCPFFRYDSDGETLIIQNQKISPFSLFVKESQSDFPKGKLVDYKIVKKFLFKKSLELYIRSKRVNSGMSKLSFDISYLSKKQVRDLNISLGKVIKENNQTIKTNTEYQAIG